MSKSNTPQPSITPLTTAQQVASIEDQRDAQRSDQLSQRLQAALTHRAPQTVHWLRLSPSTNDALKALHQQQSDLPNAVTSAVIIADQQQAGRGQSGRHWQSPKGNLYLSMLCTLATPLQGRLALEVALALLQMPTLQQAQEPRGLAVKWPNDLHHQQRKWGGILIEPLNSHQVIIGVGINVISMQHAVADQAVTDLHALLGQQVDLDQLAAESVQAIDQACQTFDAGSGDLVQRFALADSLLGQTIAVERPAQADLIGRAAGIDANGALILNTATGQQQVYSGHIRRMD